MSAEPVTDVRMDKWLWAVRLFKTRSQAIAACAAGHVKVGGQRVKPARPVHIGEIIDAQTGPITRTVKVLGLLERRLGAKAVREFVEDLTPAAEWEKARTPRIEPLFHRPKGSGRPTKRDRRLLERMGIGRPDS